MFGNKKVPFGSKEIPASYFNRRLHELINHPEFSDKETADEPRPRSDQFFKNAAIHLDRKAGYDLSNPVDAPEKYGQGHTPFGWHANHTVAHDIIKHLDGGGSDDLNTLAKIAHDSWGKAVKTSDDPANSGPKKMHRMALADTDYYKLSGEEAAKDRKVAKHVLDFYKGNTY